MKWKFFSFVLFFSYLEFITTKAHIAEGEFGGTIYGCGKSISHRTLTFKKLDRERFSLTKHFLSGEVATFSLIRRIN